MGRETGSDLQETVVNVYRSSSVVKGGRRFSFAALVVVGDGKGSVGHGYGKANEPQPAIEKGVKEAQNNMIRIPLSGTTIPHTVMARYGAARVLLKPASPGTGVIAGAAVRAVVEAAGVHDILTKSIGTTNMKNVVKATIAGLKSLRSREEVEAARGVGLE